MKISTYMKALLSSILAAVLLATTASSIHAANNKKATPPSETELIAKARADYPLKTCLVSDESLGSMGEAVAHVHKAAGKPDRVVFFCCEGCLDDFKADPAKFLKKVDDAAKNKAAGAKKSEGK
jgi:hypothetical protein